jgi:ABC-2 type transport system permease protein
VIGTLRTDWLLTFATARVLLLRFASNPIMLIRMPLNGLLLLLLFALAYQVSGQTTVPREDVLGFLVIGVIATQAWNATVWGAGNALQSEIYEGTLPAVVAAPTRITPVILGYGVGSVAYEVPGVLLTFLVGTSIGAGFDVADPFTAAICLVTLYLSTLCIGLGFSGLFILSRHSNALSNFLQAPIYLLAGFFIPRTVLPDWLQPLSDAIPISHAVDALRAAMLSGASLAHVGGQLLATVVSSAAFLVIGLVSLRRMDNALRRRATLDLL